MTRNSHSWLVPATVSLTLIPTVAAASGFALLEQSASRHGASTVGALFELSNDTRLGLSYRSSIDYHRSTTPSRARSVSLRPPAVLLDFGYAHLFSDTVPLDQDAGNAVASALLNGHQHSDIDILSTQLVYRF